MIKLINGDCLEVMKTIPDKSIDVIITDPPYGIKAEKGVGGYGKSKTDKHYSGSWDARRPNKEYFDEMVRISKKLIIFGGNYFADFLPQSTHWIVWDKKGEIKFKNPYSDCELIYTNVKKNTVKKIVFKQQGFIRDSKDKRYHPTQKPTELLMQIMQTYTEDTECVFDPFMGAGSTGVACIKAKRNFFGIELDENYFNIAKKRIEEVQNDIHNNK